jgi:hypothetical protein
MAAATALSRAGREPSAAGCAERRRLAGPRTTSRNVRARTNLDRRAAHIVGASFAVDRHLTPYQTARQSRKVVGMTESEPSPEKRRIDRRTMLAGMGVATAAAWTAPVIVDSILNPAYAFGSTYYSVDMTGLTSTANCTDEHGKTVTLGSPKACLSGTTFSTAQAIAGGCNKIATAGSCLTLTGSFTTHSSTTVTITAATGTTIFNICADGPSSSVSIANPSSGVYTVTGTGPGSNSAISNVYIDFTC